jgi:uncharacterized protein (DUF433 family)
MTTEATVKTEHPHIVMTPGTCGGRPRIDGTRIAVDFIARFINGGKTPDDILEMYPHLTPGGVYDAIAYYYDHKDEIDREIEANTPEKVLEQLNASVGPGGRIIFHDLDT